MSNILFVNSCVRTDSRTRILAQAVLSRLPGTIQEIDLDREQIPVLDGKELQQRNTLLETNETNHPMLRYARQFAQADTVVIAAPYWNLMFPALLKIHLEAITVSGITFFTMNRESR